MTVEMVVGKPAESSAELHPLIAQRWSPRALDPAAEITDEQLRAMLEAARWAPSSGNTQPARYLVGRRGDPTHARLFELLSRGNKTWAWTASALLLAAATTRNEKGEVPLAVYGVGLATANLALQAVAEGLVAHQMGGFDTDGARRVFGLPPEIRPIVMIAVGRVGPLSVLPADRRDRELAPRKRHPLSEMAFTGEWGNPLF
jgi:nitroreductase